MDAVARYRLLLEHMNEGFVAADEHHQITLVNARFATMSGYSREELRGTYLGIPLPQEWEMAAFEGHGLILIVDDEEMVVNVAQASLEGAGYSVLTASDGPQGLELFRQHADAISAVLLDLSMPKMSGQEVLRQMRAIRPDALVVVSSGFDEQETANRFGDQRPAAFLKKPFRPHQLIERMHTLINPSGAS